MRAGLTRAALTVVYDHASWRYEFQHALLTAGSDERGRRMVVELAVRDGDRVLDCGAGTGATARLAARRAGACGRVALCDASAGMLAEARARAGAGASYSYVRGDMNALPFADGTFDAVLSTYSTCPLQDPSRGAMEMYRVARPGGRIGIAHSTEPRAGVVKWLADRVENLAWKLPALSLGCRAVIVLPTLMGAGARLLASRRIGVPLWPFLVLVLEKPAASQRSV